MPSEKYNTGNRMFAFFLMASLLPSLAIPAFAASESPVSSGKTGNMALVYGSVAVISVLLLICYLLWEKKREKHFTLLFLCVCVVNCGYFLQAVARTLSGALWANRISYLGSAYLMMIMLCIVMDTCHIERKKWQKDTLFAISTAAFLLAASGDWLGLYYRSVSITTVNGVTRLVKEYGLLHILYPIYLLSYLIMMMATIVYADRKKKLASPKYAVFLLSVVLMNLLVWGVEQLIHINFEFLSVSYVATEVMLLAIYGMLQDYGIVRPGGSLVSVQMLTQLYTQKSAVGELPPNMEDLFRSFAEKVKTLTTAEHRILNYYIDGNEIADIPDLAYISIHTVKKHNRSIYQKLEVASRDELMLYIELFRCCGRLHELAGETAETE